MAERFIDFDAARAEREEEPLLLRAYGETYELPGAMPASLMLDIVRLHTDVGDDADLSTTDALAILRRVIPSAVLDLSDLAGSIVSAYMGSEDELAGEPPAPNRAERRSKTPAKSARARGSRAGSTAPRTKGQRGAKS